MSIIVIIVAFVLAAVRVPIPAAIAFGVLSHVYYLAFDLLAAFVARVISPVFEGVLLPSDAHSTEAAEQLFFRRYSIRAAVANAIGAATSLALGQWALRRLGYEALSTPLCWTLALNSVCSYMDMWYHKMHRHLWWLLIKLAAYAIVNGRI
jgi:hypothetical protein